MDIVRTISAMQARTRAAQQAGRRTVLVPTMGALHAGHLALVQRAGELGDRVVVSLFVNPTQFGPGEDLDRYPRNEARDAERCRDAGVDALFAPSVDAMYTSGHQVVVDEPEVSALLEGRHRPGHFRGVLTVVAKLLLAVQPDVAVFGRKDAQQLWLIQKMVRDLNFPVRIEAVATVREPDGLALSSRNAYLSEAHRRQAVVLHRALTRAADERRRGETDSAALCRLMQNEIAGAPDARPDYVAIVDAGRFQPVDQADAECLALLAVRFGETRLIDNIELNPPGNPPAHRPDSAAEQTTAGTA